MANIYVLYALLCEKLCKSIVFSMVLTSPWKTKFAKCIIFSKYTIKKKLKLLNAINSDLKNVNEKTTKDNTCSLQHCCNRCYIFFVKKKKETPLNSVLF